MRAEQMKCKRPKETLGRVKWGNESLGLYIWGSNSLGHKVTEIT